MAPAHRLYALPPLAPLEAGHGDDRVRLRLDVPFTAELEAMRCDWFAGLGARRAALQLAAEAVAAGDAAAERELDQELHNLIGSAGSHGVPELSAWGQEVRGALAST